MASKYESGKSEPSHAQGESSPPSGQQLPVEYEDIFPMDGGGHRDVTSSMSREQPSVGVHHERE